MGRVLQVLLAASLAFVLLVGPATSDNGLQFEDLQNEVMDQTEYEDLNEVMDQYAEGEDVEKKFLKQLQGELAGDQSFSINSQGDLNQLLQATLPYLRSRLLSLSIPDFSGSSGRVSYTLSNIRITDVQFGHTALSHNSRDTVQLTANLRVLNGALNWRYKYKWGWVRIRDSGRLTMNAGSISMSITASFQGGSSPSITSRGCSFNIGSLSVRFHGGASWIYNLFRKTIARKIKDQLNGKVCGYVQPVITREGTNALRRLAG